MDTCGSVYCAWAPSLQMLPGRELWRSSPDQLGKIKRLIKRQTPQPMPMV
ncbi:hypothetical protein HPP92_001724 [Vanilla planifolia]|uniref:Uncharacterized protein n=1 Tax=Vanilla planifolia TaxID=51239 RepID=A0A835VH75_VANPL|nr:hypothetical protein HPP92_001724 [Vanilla planifolia]